MSKLPIKIEKTSSTVVLAINGQKYNLDPFVAKQMGESLFKAGADVGAQVDAAKEKK